MTIPTNQHAGIGTSHSRKTTFARIVKYVLIGIGAVALGLCAFAAWLYFALIAGPDVMEMSDFHPFKSEKAKTQYLAFEETMAKKWPIVSEEQTVSTSYGQTFMRISGPVDGQPLVLLPGGGSNSLIWQANITALSSVYRTYALDNIYDFGRSVYTRKMNTPDDFAQWLDELFDTLSLGNDIRIVGYSYGGWVTGLYATRHPDRLSRVILIAPAFSIQPLPTDFLWDMFLGVLPCKYTLRKSLHSIWNDLAESGPEGQKIVEERVEYLYLALKSFKFKLGVEPIMLTDADLKKLTMPVLFLIGDHEKVCRPQLAIQRLHTVTRNTDGINCRHGA